MRSAESVDPVNRINVYAPQGRTGHGVGLVFLPADGNETLMSYLGDIQLGWSSETRNRADTTQAPVPVSSGSFLGFAVDGNARQGEVRPACLRLWRLSN